LEAALLAPRILYHLSKLGCHDAIMLERSELTSGSTWHAAGGMHTINGDPNVAKLQQYTIKLYQEIEELSGQNIGLHMTWRDYACRHK
jgi:dimethylglycine dehydrogenase